MRTQEPRQAHIADTTIVGPDRGQPLSLVFVLVLPLH